MIDSYGLDSTFGAGKTTLHEVLKNELPDLLHVEDGARYYIERTRKAVEDLLLDEVKQIQLHTVASSIGSHAISEHRKQGMLLDGSLVTIRPYAERLLGNEVMDKIDEMLMKYKDHMLSFIIPPTVPLVEDGLRHTDKELRVKIYKEIVETVQAFNIPHIYIISQNVEDRVKEVLYHIHNKND